MRLFFVPALAPLALVAACATTPPPSADQAGLRPALDVTGEPRGERSTYGLFLAGRVALDSGDSGSASDYYTRAVRGNLDGAFLADRAFSTALLAGDVSRAASLADAIPADAPVTRALGRLTQAVEAMSTDKPRDAQARLADPFPEPHDAGAAALKPWVAYAIGDKADALAPGAADADPLTGYFVGLSRAQLLERDRKFVEAQAVYQAILEKTPKAALTSVLYGAFLERRGQALNAAELYRNALKEAPGDPGLLADLARVEKGGPPPAMASLREGAAQALLAPAAKLLATRQPELALIYLRLVLRLDPQRDEAWMLVGDIMGQAGDMEAARAAYAHPKPGSPQYVMARSRLAWTYQQDKRGEEALKIVDAALASAPNDPDLLAVQSDLLRDNDRYAEAAAVLDRLIAAKGADAGWELYFSRGVAEERSGRWPDAERDLQKALALKPNDPSVLNYLGYAWIDRGERLQEAMGMIEKAVAAQPRSGATVDSLGWAWYRLGDYQKAVTFLERAASLEPADPEINDHLGDAYWRVGRKVEAGFQWNRVLALDPPEKIRDAAQAKLRSGLTAKPVGPSVVAGA